MRTRVVCAAMALLLNGGCIHVLERVERDERPVGEAQVLGQREVERTPAAEAELRGRELHVRLTERVVCQRHVEQQVERTDRVRRFLSPPGYFVMGTELVGALIAFSLLAQASWALVPSDHYGYTEPELISIMVLSGGVGAALIGLFGYQLIYLFDEGTRSTSASERYWTQRADCGERPLAKAPLTAAVGAVTMEGTTDAQGRALLTAPADVDLRSLLAGAGWRFEVRTASPKATLPVQVWSPAEQPAAPAAKAPTPEAAGVEAAQPADPLGDEPPVPSGPPTGGPPPTDEEPAPADEG